MPYLLSQLGYATGNASSGQYTRLGTGAGGSASYTRLYNDFYVNSFYLYTSNANPDENTSNTYVYAVVGGGSKVSAIANQTKNYYFYKSSNGSDFSLTDYGSYVRVNTREVSSNTTIQIGCVFNDGFGSTSTAFQNLTIQNTVPPLVAQYLVVGGGGGGGMASSYGGGGGAGAGGFLQGSLNLTPGTYSITVGSGGMSYAGAQGLDRSGSSGSSSTFHTITANGGGGGGSYDKVAGKNGGSGGGTGTGNLYKGFTYYGGKGYGTAGQGNDGGDLSTGNPYYNIGQRYNIYGGAGGGGASGAGQGGGQQSVGGGGAGATATLGGYYAQGGSSDFEATPTGHPPASIAANTGHGSNAVSGNWVSPVISGNPTNYGGSGIVKVALSGHNSFSVGGGLGYSTSGNTITFTSGSGTLTIS